MRPKTRLIECTVSSTKSPARPCLTSDPTVTKREIAPTVVDAIPQRLPEGTDGVASRRILSPRVRVHHEQGKEEHLSR